MSHRRFFAPPCLRAFHSLHLRHFLELLSDSALNVKRLTRVKKQFLLSLAANGGRVILGFVFFWQVSQALRLETLGEYLYVTAALGYFGALIDFGFNLFVLNTASRAEKSVRPLLLRIILSKILLTVVSVFILLGLYSVAFSQQGLQITVIFFLVVVLQSFSGLLIQFFKSLGRFDHELSSTMLASALPVVMLLAFGSSVTLPQLALIVLGVRIVVLIYQLVLFLLLTADQDWTQPDENRQALLPRAFGDIHRNFKYAIFSVLGSVFLSVDLVVMRYLLGPEDVSIYGTAMKVILATILSFEVLIGVFVPRLARQLGTSPQRFRMEARHFALFMLLGSLAVSIGLMHFGPTAILMAFGEGFVQSGDVLRALSLVLVFRVMTMVSGTMLTLHGLQGLRATIMSLIVPLHVGLNVILQSHFGYWGAVYALGTSFLLVFVSNASVLFLATQQKQNK